MKATMRSTWLVLLTALIVSASRGAAELERYVAVDNVCAWPNLTLLKDGTIVAAIFNHPSHGHAEGDVECWASTDGGYPSTVQLSDGSLVTAYYSNGIPQHAAITWASPVGG